MGAAQGENILYNLLFYSVFLTVEIKILKKDHPKENRQRLFIQSLLEQGSQPLSLSFGETPRQGGKRETFTVKKGKALGLL